MRILVTGAAGMLGSSLVPVTREASHLAFASDLVYVRNSGYNETWLDVRRPEHVAEWINHDQGPELVIHLAALTDLEECEKDTDNAWHTNAVGTLYVAQACRRAGVPMVYISTAGVFDGSYAALYTEFDQPNPLNTYGKAKFAGEQFVRENVPDHLIVRAGWMIGGGPEKDHKFISLVMNQLVAGAMRIYAVDDKYGTPTYAPDFSACLTDLIATDANGTYHMASFGTANRYDVACEIVRLRNSSAKVVPVPSSKFKDDYFAWRPRSEAMRNMRLELEGRNTMRPWQDGLAEYLRLWPE